MTNFLLGILFTQAILIWALASRKRLRRAGRLLIGLADALDGRGCKEDVPEVGDRAGELVSALMNMRVPKKKAAGAANAAIAACPQGSFEQQFRAAVKAAA